MQSRLILIFHSVVILKSQIDIKSNFSLEIFAKQQKGAMKNWTSVLVFKTSLKEKSLQNNADRREHAAQYRLKKSD